jgi:hypothetical protein
VKLLFLKLETYMAILLVLLVGVSIGMTTTLLSAAYAQEQKFSASLSGSQEVPPNTSTAKVAFGTCERSFHASKMYN